MIHLYVPYVQRLKVNFIQHFKFYFIFICMHVYVRVCVCVFMYVCVYVCECMFCVCVLSGECVLQRTEEDGTFFLLEPKLQAAVCCPVVDLGTRLWSAHSATEPPLQPLMKDF